LYRQASTLAKSARRLVFDAATGWLYRLGDTLGQEPMSIGRNNKTRKPVVDR
jgi:replication-associated recombination protein RarA|tara:strand:- start:2298 stop:2453 length:156 start_codon:yes stop_codon:yes gene_type:complete